MNKCIISAAHKCADELQSYVSLLFEAEDGNAETHDAQDKAKHQTDDAHHYNAYTATVALGCCIPMTSWFTSG